MAGEVLTQLNRIDSNIDAAFEKCRALGATMPSTINSDYLANTIETIPSSADIPVKTSDDMTASGATVTAPAGWYKQAASKSVATATQATPTITVDANGLITASTTQSAGYVSKGTKSATSQLTVQAGKTVTPTKSEQTVVEAGRYTTGAVKVAKIPDSYITTDDADAQDVDIVMNKTAYVDGKKVIGTNPYEKAATDTHIANALAEIANKGITVPSGAGVDDLAQLIKTIPREYVYTEIVSFTSSTLEQYEINHNLGVIPTYALIVQVALGSSVALNSFGFKLEYVHQGLLLQARTIQGEKGAIFGEREADTLLTYDDGSARSSPKFINATETKLTLVLTGVKLGVNSGDTPAQYHIMVGYTKKSKA